MCVCVCVRERERDGGGEGGLYRWFIDQRQCFIYSVTGLTGGLLTSTKSIGMYVTSPIGTDQ